ncbi:hypothetical protein, partial [Rossellomorea arthrocnemi]|uniref:hypothetical protein n=1 Tax=Rossellomorea arthrocnemi TaxID=2769542 RepID=UPI001E4B7453
LKPKMAILGNFLTINLSLSSFQRTIICLRRDSMGGYFACAKILDGWLFCSRKNLVKPSKLNKTSTVKRFSKSSLERR